MGAAPATAQAQEQIYDLNIPEQSLGDALRSLGRATRQNIVFDGALVRGKRSVSVQGRLTPRQAVTRMLGSTDLVMMNGSGGTLLVVKKGGNAAAATNQATTTGGNSVGMDPAESGSGNSDIIVTAQLREERLIDVPISIAALTARDLAEGRVDNIDDLPAAVPGLSIQGGGSYQRRIVLRGVSNFSGSSSLIGVYLDDTALSLDSTFQLNLQTYDLERVEVLRGPQGTLYGEGSVGGTVRFITRKAQLNSAEAALSTTFSVTKDGASSQRIEAMVNLPVADNLGFRVSSVVENAGGWIDQPAAGKNDYNGQKLADFRFQAGLELAPNLRIDAAAQFHRNNSAASIGEDSDGNFTQVFNQTLTPDGEDEYDIYRLTAAYDIGQVRLISATSLIEMRKSIRNLAFIVPVGPPGTVDPLDYLVITQDTDSKVFSQEARLASTSNSPLQWTVGAFYRDTSSELSAPINYYGERGQPGDPLPAPFASSDSLDRKSYALFGNISYVFADRLTLGAGVRYFEDKQKALAQKSSFNSTDPRVYIQYALADDINIYASVADGFRSGGFNREGQPTYGAETMRNYELGWKSRLFDGSLAFDMSVFQSDYKNYQIFGIAADNVSPIAQTSNSGAVRIRGVEWSAEWNPADQWTIGASGSILDAKFVRVDLSAETRPYLVGDRVPLVPKYQLSFYAKRDFQIGGKDAFVRVDSSRQGKSEYRLRSQGPWYLDTSDTLNQVNINAHIELRDKFSAELFVLNVLNDRGHTDPFSIESGAGRLRPLTAGISLGFTY